MSISDRMCLIFQFKATFGSAPTPVVVFVLSVSSYRNAKCSVLRRCDTVLNIVRYGSVKPQVALSVFDVV